MTVAEALKDIDQEEIIYLGARSSFMFIGTKAEFEKDLAELDALAKRLLKVKYTNLIKTATKEKQNIDRMNVENDCDRERIRAYNEAGEDFLKELSTISEDKEKRKVSKKINGLAKERRKAETRIKCRDEMIEKTTQNYRLHMEQAEKIPKQKENLISFIEREVVKIYPHEAVGEYGVTLIVEGEESGEWWTYEEYKTKTIDVRGD